MSDDFTPSPESTALDTRLTESGDSRDAAELVIARRGETEPTQIEVQYHKTEGGQPVRDEESHSRS